MTLRKENCLLYAVTDRAWTLNRTLAEQVEEALIGGVTMVQLREKNLSEEEFEQEALVIQTLCKKYRVPFLINDNVELAKRIDADGVHVGQSDMAAEKARKVLGPDKIIGVTAKTIAQVEAAVEAGADYIGSGAVFGSGTKLDAKSMDHETFQRICEYSSIPVVAIGGITKDNILQLKGRKASGVAVVSGIFAADNIRETTALLKERALQIL